MWTWRSCNRLHQLLGRHADAVVDHLEAGIGGAHRDLLGAVGMAVEAGLADQEARRLAQAFGQRLHAGAESPSS